MLLKKIILFFKLDKFYIHLNYFYRTGKICNLKKPKRFNEKIQWRKFYDKNSLHSDLSDKLKVRDYILEKSDKKYLIPLIGFYNNIEEVPFDILPDKFVLKYNHGCAYNFICKNKVKIDLTEVKKQFLFWSKINFYYRGYEYQYKHIDKKIICEEYLEDENGDLKDYKFFCFHGEPLFLGVDIDRYSNHKRNYYDMEWNKLPFSNARPLSSKKIEMPPNFKESVTLAKALSKNIDFVRVDLYILKNNIYFGEMTFTPNSGFCVFKPDYFDEFYGDLWKLN